MLTRHGKWFIAEGRLSESDLISAANEIARERLQRGDVMSDIKNTKAFCSTKIGHKEHEVFGVLYLDNRHQLIEFDEMFRGTIDGASVYPREVVKDALMKNAAAVIFTHNHPSGVPEPSRSDMHLTDKLVSALHTVDIRVLDHIVVGSEECVSFAERGLI